MIAEHLTEVIGADDRLRSAYGGDPHFHAVVANVIAAANHGSDDIDQLRILLGGLADIGAVVGRLLDGLSALAAVTPATPIIIRPPESP